MKTIRNILALLFTVLIFTSCLDELTEEFVANSPVYMSYENLRSAVKRSGSRELKHPGKIYFKDGFLFVNELKEGVHIIDNRNPATPQKIGFIEIPGNVDIAIKNNTLYADSYVDVVAIDITDLNNPVEVSRVKDVFPYRVSPVEDNQYPVADVDHEKGIVVDWEIKKIRQTLEPRSYPIYDYRYQEHNLDFFSLASVKTNGSGASYGIGGSMARFGLYNNHLYAVDERTLYMFDISEPDQTENLGNINIGNGVETMFLYDDHMFLGTRNGMLIYSLEVPTSPNYIGNFWHITSCDPVVIDNGYAYITLRGGNQCGSSINRLDILQLGDNYVDNQIIVSHPLHGPYGLGIDGDILFVCDGEAGLKVYNVADKLNIATNKIASFPDINTYDVIPFQDHLFMIGRDGFYQYDYSDINNIQQISFIPVSADE